jgi:hypothetical protein
VIVSGFSRRFMRLAAWAISASSLVSQPWGSGEGNRLAWESCCEGGYSREKALALISKIAKGRNSGTQMIMASNAESEVRVSHFDIDQATEISLLLARKTRERLTLLLQTPQGTAVDFWDGPEGIFERRLLRGRNPFQLTSSIQLIRYISIGDKTLVSCVSNDWNSTAEDPELSRVTRRLFPYGAIEIVVGDSVFFREAVSSLIMYPIHGWSSVPANPTSIRTRRWTLHP